MNGKKIGGWIVCDGFAAVEIGSAGVRGLRRAPQKWYNMRYIDMSGKLPMCRRTENAQMRYSAAYPTGREHIVLLDKMA